MKIGLIITNSYWFSPYVRIYEEILIENDINYDIISWDRDGNNESKILSFRLRSNIKSNRINRVLDYLRFKSFVVKAINRNKYDKLIIFGPQMGIFSLEFLKKNYQKKFVLDYRDLSIDQIFKRRFKELLDISAIVAISSPGFKKVLPVGYDYLISHNISRENLLKKNNCAPPFRKQGIIITTIGAIRDIQANMELIRSLENHIEITINFIGKGSEVIESFTRDIINVRCMGFYKKQDEPQLVIDSDFLNIYYPDIISHSTALSNRFYNALLFKRPMIVKSGSIQGDYVEKYNLGISLKNCSDLAQKIQDYVKDFDFYEFSNNCDLLLEEFNLDYNHFNYQIVNFLHSK